MITLYYYLTTPQICWSSKSAPCYVITLSGYDQRVPTVVSLFKAYANLSLCPYYGIDGNISYKSDEEHHLAPGERGLRDTMKNFFTMAVHNNYDEVFVFDDDTIPHLNFSTLFNQLPNRCRQADVLLLGAVINHHSREEWPTGACFDSDSRTYGSFALFVKKLAFAPILDWLRTGEEASFDMIYTHLRNQGIRVRVAYAPFLVIADLSRPSLVNKYRMIDQYTVEERAVMHDWNLENYPMSVISI
jgi:hypothetical protein